MLKCVKENMTCKELVSVIVPIYNVEKYLEKCINSLISQTYSNIEIILVDDGSSDASAKICQSYASRFSNIIFVKKENKGVSSARNIGMEKSSGSRIVFVDGDDYVDHTFIEHLYNYSVMYNAPLVRCLFDKADLTIDFSIDFHEKKAVYVDINFENILNVLSFAWGIMIKKDILDGVKFDEQIHYGEDRCFIFQLFINLPVPQVLVINESLYNYVIRKDAVTQSFVSEKRLTSMLAANKICNLCENRIELKDIALKNKHYSYKNLLYAISNAPNKKDYKTLVSFLKKEIIKLRKQGVKPKLLKENINEWIRIHFKECFVDFMVQVKKICTNF